MKSDRVECFSGLPNTARVIWAKSGEGVGHGLLAHLLDVAAVAETILRFEPSATAHAAAEALGVDPAQVARWIAALAGLHDYGKAIPGFQAKWVEGGQRDQNAGLMFDGPSLACHQHSLATAALLTQPLQQVSGAGWDWCRSVVQAVSAHHGYHFLSVEISNGSPRREPMVWREARASILSVYWDVLKPQGQPEAEDLGLPWVNWLAGLTSVADWIASNPAWFPLGERVDDLAAYYQQALLLADQALGHVGWRAFRSLGALGANKDGPAEADVHSLLARIVQRPGLQARPLQCAGDDLLRDAKGPALLLVEAPMGEGKTELAFLAHLRLQEANQHRGLYVALPTQATGNALFKRAQTFLRAFSTGPLDVQLVHGGASMNEDLASLRDIDHDANETLSASTWFGQRRRPLLSPYGVGTVDQALYAVLNVKHHFVRMWGLSNRVVVLDEVHAYDTYTSGLIVQLLRWLKALNCSVVLMSATLPLNRRRDFLAAWGQDEPAPDLAYPRLLLADQLGLRGRHVEARAQAPISLIGLGSDLDTLAEAVLEQLDAGGCGAVIVNTVSRAQSLYRSIRARLSAAGRLQETRLVLFHARFPANDRARIEAEVLSLFGPSGDRPPRALLISTQVAEQSLDIDFDFMFTDLAPVDLLLQRAGRLHRHLRDRPAAHRRARLFVAGLLPGQFPELKETAWGFVYDPYILGRTWALLTNESELNLPKDIDRWVQAVYDPDYELPDEVKLDIRQRIEVADFGEYLAEVNSMRQQAENIALDPAREAHLAYDGKPPGHEEDEAGLGLKNTTRIGGESVTLVPVVVGEDGRWHVHVDDAGFLPGQMLDATTARALYNRQVKVSRKGIVRHYLAQELPVAFASHPLLAHMRPLPLVDGRTDGSGPGLFLSPELGLVEGGGEARASPPAAPHERGTS